MILCFIKSLHHDNEDHFTAKNMISTGSGREPRPPLGSWLAYGLGTENENLPAFIEIMPGRPKSTPAAFLPAMFGSTAIGRPDAKRKDRAWDNLIGAGRRRQRRQLDLMQAMNRDHDATAADDRALDAEIQNMELAFRMQTEAPAIMSLDDESAATRKLYGIGEAEDRRLRPRLPARPPLRRAGRALHHADALDAAFGNLWDQHKDLYDGHRNNAAAVDVPIAGLLRDLQSRGHARRHAGDVRQRIRPHPRLRIPGRRRRPPPQWPRPQPPRLHHVVRRRRRQAAASATAQPTTTATTPSQDKVSVHDLHATILHCMGIDHEKLTYRYGGRDYRLTDVSGEVVKGILA